MKIKIVVAFLVILKIAVVSTAGVSFIWGSDENGNYSIAENCNKGIGHVALDKRTGLYKNTTSHTPFAVYIYTLLQNSGISKTAWLIIFWIAAITLYAISLFYFFALTAFFIQRSFLRYAALILYGLFPSVIYYIGALFYYENIALPILIIIIYRLITGLESGFSPVKTVLIALGITISSLLKVTLIFIYMFVLAVFFVFALKKYRGQYAKFANMAGVIILSFILLTAAQLPILLKNHAMFGHYILTNQSGFELLQGHNPFARGSWSQSIAEDTNSDFYKWVEGEIPGIRGLNEYEESRTRRALAWKWIRSHPLSEASLAAKKLAIYFLPQNHSSITAFSRFYNPVDLLVYALFIVYLLKRFTVDRKTPLGAAEALVLTPFIASIALSIIFFVVYRCRYYAEPFMIILAMSLFSPKDHRA